MTTKSQLPIIAKDCLQKNIDNILIYKKNTPTTNEVKIPMHRDIKQTQKNTKTANSNKCIKVQKPKKCKVVARTNACVKTRFKV